MLGKSYFFFRNIQFFQVSIFQEFKLFGKLEICETHNVVGKNFAGQVLDIFMTSVDDLTELLAIHHFFEHLKLGIL